MIYNFDELIDRNNTNCFKYDFTERFGIFGYNYIPLWIADMDFRSPPSVVAALQKRIEHGIFGYSDADFDYYEAVRDWLKNRHGWQVQEEWLVRTPSVLNAISVILSTLTKPQDMILVQTPSYNMFKTIIEKNGRRVAKNQLILENGKYTIDFDDFEKQIKRNNVKMFFLCSPHNPISRVWTKEELIRMGDICLKYDVIVVADEVHEDFVYDPYKHCVFSSLKSEYQSKTITCTSPAKTFNISGLPISNIFIPDEDMRDDIKDEIFSRGTMGSGLLEVIACQAAYREGAEWLDALVAYLTESIALVRTFLQEKIPEVKLVEPEGTYLLWLDFRGLGFWGKELEVFLENEARILLGGAPGGEGFQRLNIACPRSVLHKAFTQLENAVKRKRR
jgi:cystathionine beta-lyase